MDEFKVGDIVTFKDSERNRESKAYAPHIGKRYTVKKIRANNHIIEFNGSAPGSFAFRLELVPQIILNDTYSID